MSAKTIRTLLNSPHCCPSAAALTYSELFPSGLLGAGAELALGDTAVMRPLSFLGPERSLEIMKNTGCGVQRVRNGE